MAYGPEAPLQMAERHVAEAEVRVARQAELVDELARDGHDTTLSEELLATLRATLELMRQDLDRQRAMAGGPQ